MVRPIFRLRVRPLPPKSSRYAAAVAVAAAAAGLALRLPVFGESVGPASGAEMGDRATFVTRCWSKPYMSTHNND